MKKTVKKEQIKVDVVEKKKGKFIKLGRNEYLLKFQHLRNKNEEGLVLGKGGTTISYINMPLRNKLEVIVGEIVVSGYAFCSDVDSYCKEEGRHLATDRLKEVLVENYLTK